MSKKSARDFTRWFQEQLAGLGYKVEVTGENDAATQAAIRDFQDAQGLEQTGTATDETVKAVRDFKPAGLTGTVTAGQAEGGSVAVKMKLAPPPKIEGKPDKRPTPSRPYWNKEKPKAPSDVPLPAGPEPVSAEEKAAVADFWKRFDAGTATMDDYPTAYGKPEQQNIAAANSPLAGTDSYVPPTQVADMPTVRLPYVAKQPAPGQFDTAFADSPAATAGPWAGPDAQGTQVAQRDKTGAPAALVSPQPPSAPQGQYPTTVGLPWGRKYNSIPDMIGAWGQGGMDAAKAVFGNVVGQPPPMASDTFGEGRGGPWLRYRKRTD